MPATPYLPPLLPLTISEDAWGSFGMLEFKPFPFLRSSTA